MSFAVRRNTTFDSAERATTASEVVFVWHWHGRDLGRDFESREQAIDWMVRWLDEDTEAQGLDLRV